MPRAVQQRFLPLPKGDPRCREPLVVHARAEQPAARLVVLVHGWNGGRYSTWQRLAAFLYDDLPDTDLGLYDYLTGSRRRPGAGPSLRAQAENLAHTVRESAYGSVALVCHSLGGLVAARAVADLVHSQSRDPAGRVVTDRLAGLFLCGSPMSGVRWVPWSLGWLSPDLRWLATHSSEVDEIAKTFADRVVAGPPPAPAGMVVLPTYALVGAKDRVVDGYSAGMRLPSDHRHTAIGDHRELVKPRIRENQSYQWLLSRLRLVFDAHASRAGDGAPEQQRVTLRFGTVREGHVTGVGEIDGEASVEASFENVEGGTVIGAQRIVGRRDEPEQ